MIKTLKDNKKLIRLWLFFMPAKLLPISKEEEKWVKSLTISRGWIYHFSRGFLRQAISNMTASDPLKIPLKADPGKPPKLAKGWGYVSISHCSDALLIGWSSEKIGVDIERKDRELEAHKISKRFFGEEENRQIENLTSKKAKEEVLNRWVVKEAATKWQESKISTNLDKWRWDYNSIFAYHKDLGHRVRIYKDNYDKWTYAIALNENSKISNPIVCIN